MAQYVILTFYKEDSGSVNGDQDRKPVPLTRLSSGRRVSVVLPTAFVSEVVPMVFRRTKIQLSRNGTCGLAFSSSFSTHLARFASPTVFGRVSPTTLFRCDTSRPSSYSEMVRSCYAISLQHNTIDIIVGHAKYLRDKMRVHSEARRQTMK